jgi:hypothetical protein
MNPDKRRHIGEAIVLTLYFIIDGIFLWPLSHSLALLLGVAGISAVCFAELPIRIWVSITVLAGSIAVMIYFVAPPTPREETETHGWLEPGNDPMPKDICTELPKHAVLIAIGDSGAYATKPGKYTVLTIGRCNVVEFELRQKDQMIIDADVFDTSVNLTARIRSNEFNLVPGQIAYGTRPDRYTLVVTGKKGEELFWARYLNPRAARIRGVFSCENHAPITITDRGFMVPRQGGPYSGLCAQLMSGGIGIRINVSPN